MRHGRPKTGTDIGEAADSPVSAPEPPALFVTREQKLEVMSCDNTIHSDQKMEATMPILLWLLGVPIVVVIALMLTHVI